MNKVLLSLLIAVAAVGLIVAGSTAPAATGLKVTSTLDGMNVLPHRIHWLGLPTLAASKIDKVEFLIDGKLRWVEQHCPCVYGGDSGRHRNYLVTSWLTPGRHRFSVRAVAKNGQTATDTVRARVVPPPKVPAALAGTWERTISDTSGAPKPGSPGNPTDSLTPPGRYRITFDRPWIHDVFPCDTNPCRFNSKTGGGGELISDWTPGASTFTVRGPVTIRIMHNTDRLGGFWCYEDGPTARYSWTVDGASLKLAPIGGHDTCGIRGFVWTGTWTRVG